MQVELGKIVGVWGVKGWVKLHSYTRNRADIANYTNWTLLSEGHSGKNTQDTSADHGANYKVLACREQGKGIVAQLQNIDNREQAESLINHSIFVDQSDMPGLPAGEYYWHELIGLTVSNADGLAIGDVTSILETGANDVLVVKPNKTKVDEDTTEVLIPYVDERVLEIDLKAGTLLVDWDPEYLND